MSSNLNGKVIKLDDIPNEPTATEHPEVTMKREALEKLLMKGYFQSELTDRECLIMDLMNDNFSLWKKEAENHLKEAERSMKTLFEMVELHIGNAREEMNFMGSTEVIGDIIQDQLYQKELEKRKGLAKEVEEFTLKNKWSR